MKLQYHNKKLISRMYPLNIVTILRWNSNIYLRFQISKLRPIKSKVKTMINNYDYILSIIRIFKALSNMCLYFMYICDRFEM